MLTRTWYFGPHCWCCAPTSIMCATRTCMARQMTVANFLLRFFLLSVSYYFLLCGNATISPRDCLAYKSPQRNISLTRMPNNLTPSGSVASFSRYRIVTTVIPRMAPRDATRAQPATARHTEPRDCLIRVLRTRRMKPTQSLPIYRRQRSVIQRHRFLIERDKL